MHRKERPPVDIENIPFPNKTFSGRRERPDDGFISEKLKIPVSLRFSPKKWKHSSHRSSEINITNTVSRSILRSGIFPIGL